MSKGFSLLTRLRRDAPKDFITPVTHHAELPMQPSRRHFVTEIAIQLHLSILVVNLVILPNYRMINYDSMFNLSSGVTCNWCIQLDATQTLALFIV